MNILQIYNKIPIPPKDGGSIAVFNLISEFSDQGHHVDLLVFNTKKHYISKEELNTYKYKNIESLDINTDINILTLVKNLLFSKKPLNAERFISKRFAEKLRNKIKSNNYDIIQIEGLYMMPYINVIKKNSKAIVTYRAHNIEHEIWETTYKNTSRGLRRLYIRALKKRLRKFELSYINKYDALIPLTFRDAQIFENLGNNKKIHICPVGINFDKYSNLTGDINKISLFFLGSLDWIPNQEGLLWFLENVWLKISKNYPELIFSIAGRNAPSKFIHKIEKFKAVNFLGEIDHVPKYLSQHNTMIVPLFSGSGIRVKIIEGMAAGKVIITTSKGAEGIPSTNEENILIADNEEDYIFYIEALIEKRISLKKITTNAKKLISYKFDNFAVTNSLIQFYQEIIK